MNTARVAMLLRELADELEHNDAPAPPVKPSRRTQPKRKRVRQPFVPIRQLSEIEIERARQRARKLGIAIG